MATLIIEICVDTDRSITVKFQSQVMVTANCFTQELLNLIELIVQKYGFGGKQLRFSCRIFRRNIEMTKDVFDQLINEIIETVKDNCGDFVLSEHLKEK